MRVIVTGGLGFIGSFLAEGYRDAGHDVMTLDNESASVVDAVPGCVNWIADAREIVKADTLFEPDLIVHCASPVGAVAILEERGSIASEIVATTEAVAAVCAERGISMLNISTSEVYGRSGVYYETDDLIVPAKHNARLEYAVGKIAAEFIVKNRPELKSLTIRPFNVAGPRQTSAKGFAIPTFVEQALAGEPITVFDDGTQERSFTAVHDLVEFCTSLEAERFDGGIVNLGNPANRINIRSLAALVKDVCHSESDVEFTTGKAVHGEHYEEAEGHIKVPSTGLAETYGWHPEVNLRRLVELTAAEYAGVTSGAGR